MDDLIKRTEVIKAVHEFFAEKVDEVYGDRDEVAAGEIDFILKYNKELNGRIEEIPTVEAKPVVHGEWIDELGLLFPEFRCSKCKKIHDNTTNFCPNCGADMRKKVQE